MSTYYIRGILEEELRQKCSKEAKLNCQEKHKYYFFPYICMNIMEIFEVLGIVLFSFNNSGGGERGREGEREREKERDRQRERETQRERRRERDRGAQTQCESPQRRHAFDSCTRGSLLF